MQIETHVVLHGLLVPHFQQHGPLPSFMVTKLHTVSGACWRALFSLPRELEVQATSSDGSSGLGEGNSATISSQSLPAPSLDSSSFFSISKDVFLQMASCEAAFSFQDQDFARHLLATSIIRVTFLSRNVNELAKKKNRRRFTKTGIHGEGTKPSFARMV